MKPIEEPTRWLDPRSDAPAELRALLGDARDALGPKPEELERLASFAVAAGAAGMGFAGKAAAAAHGASKAMAVKIAVVLAVAGGGGGVGWAVLHDTRAPSTAAPSPTAAPPATAAPVVPSAADAPADAATAAPPQTQARPEAPSRNVAPAAPPPSAVVRPNQGSAPAPASAPRLLEPAAAPSELALLTRARERIATDPGGALQVLDDHRARYPRGALEQEREVLAIEALVRLGRRAEAERRAAAFASAFPQSAHRRRIAVLLGADAGGD